MRRDKIMPERILIIGGGAAGLMAAGTLAGRGKDVTILERNEKLAKKVAITGKGRCNVTNNCKELSELIANVPVNGRFLYSAFSNFMPSDTVELFEDMGVQLKCERGNRVFPCSDKAMDIVNALVHYGTDDGAEIITDRAKELIIENGALKGVRTYEGEEIFAEKVIVATGGKSYPLTGSTGDGYELAKQAGHTIIEPKPSLVPLSAHEGFCSELMGLSLRNVSMKVIDTERKNKVVYDDFGEMLFTHFGVSGPMVLSASSVIRDMKNGRYIISIDLKSALSEEQLDARILRDFSENTNKDFINSLSALLPRKLIPVVVKLSGIKANEKVNQITKEQRHKLVRLLKDFRVTVKGFRPIDEAIITSGGVKVSEIDPKTMQSKLLPGLYFAGEVIDVDAYTGGFNLQIAFSTGRLAGENV